MGSVTQMLKNAAGPTDDEKEQKERLEFLPTCAKAKIRAYRDEITEMFLNPESVQKAQIPGIRAIRFIEQYHVTTSEGLNEKVSDHIGQTVNAFFSISGDSGDKAKIQTGVSAPIETALDGFIGNTSVGESEEKIYVIVPENNAFVRADIACWKYGFSQSKFIDQNDTAMAYVLCKSVVDHTKLSIDELIYLVTDSLSKKERSAIPSGDPIDCTAKYQKQLDAIVAVGEIRSLIDAKASNPAEKPALASEWDQPAVKEQRRTMPLGSHLDFTYDTNNKVWKPLLISPNWALVDGNTMATGTPATISEVQAYIEELIAVWKKLRDDR